MAPRGPRNSVRSWPTQNPRPAPVITTARTSGSRASRRPAANARCIAESNALRTSGRFSVSVSTPPSRVTSTSATAPDATRCAGASVAAMAELTFISDVRAREEEPLDAYSRVVTEVARILSPSVANLRFRRGGGSGVVITPDGFVLTSAHVVARTRSGIASFVDGRELRVDVVGSDPLSDLAVLRADSNGLAAAELGDADSLQVGQLVVAIGNPHGFAGSVTAGVVCAPGRSLPTRSGSPSRILENLL